MGTSVSHGSPKNSSSWKRVFACYKSSSLPEKRVVNEVWRASETAEKGTTPLSLEMKSRTIFDCYEAVKSSKNFQEAMQKFNSKVLETKSNSIIAEFAKRAIPSAFQAKDPSQKWTNSFFKEVTSYVISRDASGFVGADYRNKSVSELLEFKKNLSKRVGEIVSSETRDFKSHSEWQSFVDRSIQKLKSSS